MTCSAFVVVRGASVNTEYKILIPEIAESKHREILKYSREHEQGHWRETQTKHVSLRFPAQT